MIKKTRQGGEHMASKRNDVDWSKIKAEYITGTSSLGELAERYGVSKSAIQKRSSSGKWSQQRKNAQERHDSKVIEAITDKKAKQTLRDIDKVVSTAQKLLRKINKAVGELGKEEYLSEKKQITRTSHKSVDEGVDDYEDTTKTIRTYTRRKALIDAKKLSLISSSLLNVKEIFMTLDDNNADDEEYGIIQIPKQIELEPPEDAEDEADE